MNVTEKLYPFGERVTEAVLDNGLTVRVLPRPSYRKCVACFGTDFGGADRRYRLNGESYMTPAGTAHYLEHKLFDMPDGNALAALNASGADPNAYTSESCTMYHFECTQDFDTNLRTLLRFVSTPYFTQESVDKERGIIAQEIRMGDDSPGQKLYDDLFGCLYHTHPLRDSIAGTVESIADITPQTLYDCHAVFYRPSNMMLTAVGPVEPEAVLRAAEELLPSDWSEKPGKDYGGPEPPLPLKTRSERRMEVARPLFLLGCRAEDSGRGEDFYRRQLLARTALQCLAGRTTPFFSRLYAEGLLNLSFDADAEFLLGQRLLTFSGETDEPERVYDALRTELDRVGRDGIDPALFDRIQKSIYGGRLRALDSPAGLAVSLAESVPDGVDPLDDLRLLETLTADEVSAFLRDSFPADAMAMSVIRPV